VTYSSKSQETVDTVTINRIKKETFNHSHIPKIAHCLTEVSGSRLMNSPGYLRASTWAVKQLKEWGLNAFLESFGEFGKGWEIEKSYVALKFPYYAQLIASPVAWTGSTNGLVKAPVILINVNDSTAIEKNRILIKDKIVMLVDYDTTISISPFEVTATRYSDSTLNNLGDLDMVSKEELSAYSKMLKTRRNRLRKLKEYGAVALLSNGYGRDGTIVVAGLSYRKERQPTIPEMALSAEDFLKIRRLIKSQGLVEIEIDVKTKLIDGTQGYNVIGEISGTDPKLKDEVVIIGAHLDSWHSATGATDNAAGCAVMMEAVRIIKSLGIQPKRTIRIALWGGEEQGLIGSFNYVKMHFGDPKTMKLKTEQSKISAYYNLDNGTGKIRGIYTQNNEGVIPLFQKWLIPFKDFGAAKVAPYNVGATDHLPFDAVGIPAFQFIQDPIEYETRTHHSNMDTYDHLLLDDLKQSAALVAAFVYNTAMRKDMLTRKPLPQPESFVFESLKVDEN